MVTILRLNVLLIQSIALLIQNLDALDLLIQNFLKIVF